MKKYIIFLSAFVITAVAVASIDLSSVKPNAIDDTKVLSAQNTAKEKAVTLDINLPDQTISQEVAFEEGQTAYSILQNSDKVTLQIKQYDFGVFVESINDYESNADNSWIYYINGESGQIAADQATLKPGDKVEWKYEPVTN